MTSNQLHGKKFEDFIKACGMFPGASDAARSATADFDIEAHFDRKLGLPTSIKASGNDTIALSDARRFFGIDEDFRMIVGRYQQEGERKVFAQIHEFILGRKALGALRGQLGLAIVTAFHDGLLIDKFPRGKHKEAREWAAERKRELSGLNSLIILNPKIGANGQRRLQCSVHMRDLAEFCGADGAYIIHDKAIGDFVLPVIQNSERRKIGPNNP